MAKDDDRTEIDEVRNIKPQSGKGPQHKSPDTIIYRNDKAGGPGYTVDNDRTIIHRHFSGSTPPAAEATEAADADATEIVDPAAAQPAADAGEPVVGWLVITHGPGRGRTLGFFEGMNSVGRDAGQRVRLDFGDKEVSRESHFFVTFEPKKRTFHLNHGGRSNLVYLNGDALLAPMALNKGDIIEVGQTKLMFVPLCGPDFSWDA